MKHTLSDFCAPRALWLIAILGTILTSVARAQNFTTSNFAINGQVMSNMGTYYATPGQTITFSGDTHDDDGDLIWGIFYVNGPNLPGWNALSPVPISGTDASPSESWTIPNTAGTYAATYRAMDNAGNYDSNGGSFMVYIAALYPMQPPTSSSYTIPFGVSWNGPAISAPSSNGTGTLMYCVANETPWISGPWTPNATGTFQLYVGQIADSTHIGNITDPIQGNMEANSPTPYTVTVVPASASFTLSPGSFTYDGSTKTVSVVANPSGATYTVTSGVLSATNAGTYNVTITATGNYSGTSNVSWTINQAGINLSISPSSQSINTGQSITFNASGGAGTGSYVWGGDAAGAGSGSSVTVTFNTAGTRTVTVYQNGDSNYSQSNTATATITVTNVAPPTYSLTVQNGSGSASGLTAGTQVGISANGAPSGQVFSGWVLVSGSGSFGNAGLGSTTFTIGSQNTTISATYTQSQPVVSSGSISGTVNSPISNYQIQATNSPTSYGASGLPAGLSVNTTTGVISGTPTQTGTFNATISATNAGGTGTAALSVNISAAVDNQLNVHLPVAP